MKTLLIFMMIGVGHNGDGFSIEKELPTTASCIAMMNTLSNKYDLSEYYQGFCFDIDTGQMKLEVKNY